MFMTYNRDYKFALRRQTGSFSSCISALPESVCCYYLISVAIRKFSPMCSFLQRACYELSSFFFLSIVVSKGTVK